MLRAVAGAVRDGEVVDLPHLGRLRPLSIERGFSSITYMRPLPLAIP
jgi:hypothetical protein